MKLSFLLPSFCFWISLCNVVHLLHSFIVSPFHHIFISYKSAFHVNFPLLISILFTFIGVLLTYSRLLLPACHNIALLLHVSIFIVITFSFSLYFITTTDIFLSYQVIIFHLFFQWQVCSIINQYFCYKIISFHTFYCFFLVIIPHPWNLCSITSVDLFFSPQFMFYLFFQ